MQIEDLIIEFEQQILNLKINNTDEEGWVWDDFLLHFFYKGDPSLVSVLKDVITKYDKNLFNESDRSIFLSYIIKRFKTEPNRAQRIGWIHLLGKFCDNSLVPLLRKELLESFADFKLATDRLTNSIVALSNCGEQIISDNSFASFEYEKNFRDARIYIENNKLLDD